MRPRLGPGGGRSLRGGGDLQRHVGGAAHFGRPPPAWPIVRLYRPPTGAVLQEAHDGLVAAVTRGQRGAAHENTGKVESTISVQDYAKTGSDRAAGRATWTAALVITAILVPWALCCRGLRSVAGGLRRPVSAVARAVLVVLAS